MIPLREPCVFKYHSGSITIAADKVMFSPQFNPCPLGANAPPPNKIISIPLDSVTFGENKIQGHGGGLEGTVTGTLETDKNGLKWFCQSAPIQ